MTEIRVDFNKPCIVGKEFEYINDAFNRSHISGDGYYTKRCQDILENELGTQKVLLTTSCTHALEMAAILVDIKPGDEVVVPSFTFVSTVNAFVLRGARPVFIDIHPDTLNLDEELLEKVITNRTKGIVPVHYAGVGCEMDKILGIANQYGLWVIEDNAHGLFGKFQGRHLGTFGKMATQSFHETKNISCGEGGAIIINDPEIIERSEIIREKGTNRSRFFRGMVDKYTWVDIGSSYLPSDILAAILYAQLEKRVEIQEKRKRIWEFYYSNLKQWADAHDVLLPNVPSHCDQSYHMFYMLMPTLNSRTLFINNLKERGIISVFHYQPLHLSEMGRNYGGTLGDCPITEKISDQLIRLPFHFGLSAQEQDLVLDSILRMQI